MNKGIDKPRIAPSAPLSELGLPVRVHNMLRRAGVATVGDLTALDEDGLYAIRNVGGSTFAEVIVKLDEHGLDITHTAAAADLDYSEVAGWWTP